MRPGRIITVAALTVALLLAAAAAVRIVRHQTPPLLGTNGVGVGAPIASLPHPGDRVCLAKTPVPKRTRALQLWLGWHSPTPVVVSGALRLSGGGTVALRPTPISQSAGWATLPLASEVARDAWGTLCFRRGPGAGSLDIIGANVIRAAGEQTATVNGETLAQNEPSMRMLSNADGRWVSASSAIGAAVSRLATLSPSPLGVAGIVFVLLVLMPASLALLLWNLATAPRRSRRRIAALCVLASAGITTGWATITPTFQGPDEPEHFAYAQHLAMTGTRADAAQTARPPYSSQQSAVLAALHNNAVVIEGSARQPWTQLTRDTIDQAARLPRGDGGGYTESASGHSAFYYVLVAPAIHLAGSSLETELWFARLETALLAALIAGFAAWSAGILVPGRPRLAALAGLAAATVPMAGVMGGTVNNDTLVNVFAAAAFAVVASVLVSSRDRPGRFAAIGALVVALPVAKASGLGVAAAFAGAAMIAAVRAGSVRRALTSLALLAAGAAGAMALLALGATVLVDGQPLTLLNTHPVVPGAAATAPSLTQRFPYVFETLVPFLHPNGVDFFIGSTPYQHVYLAGLWSGFGWARIWLPPRAFDLLQVGVIVGIALGLAALWRERARWLDRKLATLAVLLTPFIAIAFVAFAYAAFGPRPKYPEQGRYLLIALVPLALWFTALPGAFPAGRWRSAATGAVGGVLAGLSVIGVLVAIGGFAV